MWMVLIVFYGICKGSRELFKKKAFEKASVMETLYVYTLISFIFVTPCLPSALGMDFAKFLPAVIIKAFIIFIAWLFGFYAIKNMPVSLYGVLDLSRVLFSTGLGVIVLHESLGVSQIIGLILVCAGLLALKISPKKKTPGGGEKEAVSTKYVVLAFTACFLNAVSGTMDKALLGGTDITDNQLLFWYTLFLVIFYTLYILITKTKIRWKQTLKNPWIYLMSLTFALGDKALFIANTNAGSTVAAMTLLKQAGCIVIILGGKFIFKEKRVGYKLFCAGVIIAGIVIAVL